jgi:hypothetical protein
VQAIRQQGHGTEGHARRNLNHHGYRSQDGHDQGAPFTPPDLILPEGMFMCPRVKATCMHGNQLIQKLYV